MTITFKEAVAVPHKYRNRFLRDGGGSVIVGGSSSVGDGSSINYGVFLKKTDAENIYFKKEAFDELFEKVTLSDGTTAIKAKMSLFSVGGLSAYGFNSDSGGGGGEAHSMIHAWSEYTTDAAMTDYVVSAKALKPDHDKAHTHSNKSLLDGITSTTTSEWYAAFAHSQSAHAPSNAQKNVQSDWNATSGDALILNKPTIPSTTKDISEDTNLYFTDARAQSALSGHTGDTTKHITSAERTSWNNKWDYNESTIKGVKVDSATSSDSCTGNAASATKLQTARSLWGQSFDGSDDVNGDMSVNGKITSNKLQIGNAVLEYDEDNAALKLSGNNGDQLNMYATGGISAYGGLGSHETLDSLSTKHLTTHDVSIGDSEHDTSGTIRIYGTDAGDFVEFTNISVDNNQLYLTINNQKYRIGLTKL